jgi:hypothetical protein
MMSLRAGFKFQVSGFEFPELSRKCSWALYSMAKPELPVWPTWNLKLEAYSLGLPPTFWRVAFDRPQTVPISSFYKYPVHRL